MNEFITQRFTKTDSTDLEPVCHEPPTLEQSLAWLNSQGECAAIALAHFNDQIASLQREKVIAKEINDALMDKNKKLEEEIKSANCPLNENIILKQVYPNIEAVALEVAAEFLWESEPHHLLAAGGYPTKWEDQCSSIKRGMLKKVRTVVRAYLDKAGEA